MNSEGSWLPWILFRCIWVKRSLYKCMPQFLGFYFDGERKSLKWSTSLCWSSGHDQNFSRSVVLICNRQCVAWVFLISMRHAWLKKGCKHIDNSLNYFCIVISVLHVPQLFHDEKSVNKWRLYMLFHKNKQLLHPQVVKTTLRSSLENLENVL